MQDISEMINEELTIFENVFPLEKDVLVSILEYLYSLDTLEKIHINVTSIHDENIDELLLSLLKSPLKDCCFYGWNPVIPLPFILERILSEELNLDYYDYIPIDDFTDDFDLQLEYVSVVNQVLLCELTTIFPVNVLQLELYDPRVYNKLSECLLRNQIQTLTLTSNVENIIHHNEEKVIVDWESMNKALQQSRLQVLILDNIYPNVFSVSTYHIIELKLNYVLEPEFLSELKMNQTIQKITIETNELVSLDFFGDALLTTSIKKLKLRCPVVDYELFFKYMAVNNTLEELALQTNITQHDFDLFTHALFINRKLRKISCPIRRHIRLNSFERVVKANDILEDVDFRIDHERFLMFDNMIRSCSSSIYKLDNEVYYRNGLLSRDTWMNSLQYQERMIRVEAFRQTPEYQDLVKDVDIERKKILKYVNMERRKLYLPSFEKLREPISHRDKNTDMIHSIGDMHPDLIKAIFGHLGLKSNLKKSNLKKSNIKKLIRKHSKKIRKVKC